MDRLFGANSGGVGISWVLMSEFVTDEQDNSEELVARLLPLVAEQDYYDRESRGLRY